MDTIYKLLKINRLVKNYRIKFLALIVARTLGIRHLSIRLDPAIACNLKCKMCSFGTSKEINNKKSVFTEDDINALADSLFPKALQVIIGCSYEPTVYKKHLNILELARKYKVPYTGYTSNGQLLTYEDIDKFIFHQLSELTLSSHGVTKETYEELMPDASYDKFHKLLELIHSLKIEKESDLPKLRINYTVNSRNIDELEHFFDIYGKYDIKTLQLRPMFGDIFPEGKLSDADITKYRIIVDNISHECKKRDITLLANIGDEKFHVENYAAIIFPEVYYYVNPDLVWKDDFDYERESYEEYCKRTGYYKYLLLSLFQNKKELLSRSAKFSGSGRYNVT